MAGDLEASGSSSIGSPLRMGMGHVGVGGRWTGRGAVAGGEHGTGTRAGDEMGGRALGVGMRRPHHVMLMGTARIVLQMLLA